MVSQVKLEDSTLIHFDGHELTWQQVKPSPDLLRETIHITRDSKTYVLAMRQRSAFVDIPADKTADLDIVDLDAGPVIFKIDYNPAAEEACKPIYSAKFPNGEQFTVQHDERTGRITLGEQVIAVTKGQHASFAKETEGAVIKSNIHVLAPMATDTSSSLRTVTDAEGRILRIPTEKFSYTKVVETEAGYHAEFLSATGKIEVRGDDGSPAASLHRQDSPAGTALVINSGTEPLLSHVLAKRPVQPVQELTPQEVEINRILAVIQRETEYLDKKYAPRGTVLTRLTTLFLKFMDVVSPDKEDDDYFPQKEQKKTASDQPRTFVPVWLGRAAAAVLALIPIAGKPEKMMGSEVAAHQNPAAVAQIETPERASPPSIDKTKIEAIERPSAKVVVPAQRGNTFSELQKTYAKRFKKPQQSFSEFLVEDPDAKQELRAREEAETLAARPSLLGMWLSKSKPPKSL